MSCSLSVSRRDHYIITPSASNPFFGTEQRVGAAKATALGYTPKCFSHDDDGQHSFSFSRRQFLTKQSQSSATTPGQTLQSRQYEKQSRQKFPCSSLTAKSTLRDSPSLR
ncbi:MAG: hypothetical protein IKQ95_03885 [Synergistaceae bacterium]|nr:hypothetical protein [Synergistaceae bacterium]